MKVLSVALALALGVVGCTTRYTVPGPADRPATWSPPTPLKSVIRLPVTMPWAPLEAQFKAEMLKALPEKNRKGVRDLTVHTHHFVDVCQLKPQAVVACGVAGAIVTGVQEVFLPDTIRVDYDAQVVDSSASLSQQRLTASATIEFSATATGHFLWGNGRVASCGVNEEKPRVRLETSGDLVVQPDRTVTVSQWGPTRFEWKRPCRITAFDIDAQWIVDLLGFRDKEQGLIDRAVSSSTPKLELAAQLDKVWAWLSRDFSLGVSQSSLRLNPNLIQVGPISGSSGSVTATLSVHATPDAIFGTRAPGADPGPVVFSVGSSEPGFTIQAHVTASLDALRPLLLDKVQAFLDLKVPGTWRKWLEVAELRAYGSGENAVVAVTLTRPLRVTLFLWATPRLELSTLGGEPRSVLRFGDVRWTEESRHFLDARVGELVELSARGLGFDDWVRDAIQTIEVPFSDELNRARAGLKDAVFVVTKEGLVEPFESVRPEQLPSPHTLIRVNVDRIEATYVYLTPQAINALVTSTGTVAVEITDKE